MNEEEYLNLFKKIKNDENSLNEKKDEWQSLNETPNMNQWESLNETPNMNQYNINENINDGWGTQDFQVETRINGIPQQRNQQQYQQPRRRKNMNDPNGLNQYLEENLNEVVQHNDIPQPSPVNENINDTDVVSVELFNRINENAMLTLAGKSNNVIQRTDTSRMTNNDDRKIRIIKS